LFSLASQSLGLLLLGVYVAQALLQSSDLAEPLHPVRFVEPFAGVGLDLQQARDLSKIQPEHGTTDTGFSELGDLEFVVAAHLDRCPSEQLLGT